MRILFITNLPSPYRVDFFNELGKYSDLTVLFERKSATDRDAKWKHEKYLNFKAIFLKGKAIGNDSSIGIDALKYFTKSLYDIFVFAGYASPTAIISIFCCRLRRIPYVISSDGAFIKKESFYKRELKRLLIGGASAWLCTGKTSSEYLKQYGAKEDRIYIYPFTSIRDKDIIAQPLNEKDKIEIKNRLGMKEGKIVLSVGRFIYSKGYDILLDACSGFDKKIGVYIIGGTPTKEYLDLKDKLMLTNVHFVDFKLKKDLDEYYKAADVFVLPTRGDVWGLVINEAMAKGLPIITTNQCIAGLELIQNDQNGFILTVEDAKLLSDKILILINDNDLCRYMAINNVEKIHQYTIEEMAKKHSLIFSQIEMNKSEGIRCNM